MRAPLLPAVAAVLFAVGCGDGGIGPVPDPAGEGQRLATQFIRLADSVSGGEYSPTAEALRHAADIVRLTGHATPVTLTIDGTSRSFLAVAEQIDYPNLVCSWPSDSGTTPPPDTVSVPPPDSVPMPPDSTGATPPGGGGDPIPVDSGVVLPPPLPEPPTCTVSGTSSMRTLIAWEPEHMAEVARVVAYIGSSGVEPGVPDVMTGLPTGAAADPAPPDSGSGSGGEPGGYPGFMGQYLVRDVGSWWAFEGSQSNDLVRAAGACTEDRATFDWAEFGCAAAGFRFQFSMSVEPPQYEPLTGGADPPGGPEGSHTLAMAASAVDGVRLTWLSWTPPPEPGPGPDPLPPDSSATALP